MKFVIVFVISIIQSHFMIAQNIKEENETLLNDSLSHNLKLKSVLPFKNALFIDTFNFSIQDDIINVGDTIEFAVYDKNVLIFKKEIISKYTLLLGSEVKIANNQMVVLKYTSYKNVYCPSCQTENFKDSKYKRVKIIKNLYQPFCQVTPYITTSNFQWNLNLRLKYPNKNDIPLIMKKTIGTPVYPSQSVSNLHSESSLNNLNLLPVSQTYLLKPTTYAIKIIQTQDGYQEVYCLY